MDVQTFGDGLVLLLLVFVYVLRVVTSCLSDVLNVPLPITPAPPIMFVLLFVMFDAG